jgi:hypothetical protein
MMMAARPPLVGGRLHGQGGTGGGEARLEALAITQLPLPHLLDVLLDVSQLTDLRFCKVGNKVMPIFPFYFSFTMVDLKDGQVRLV